MMGFIVYIVLLVMLIGFPAVVGAVMGLLYGGANAALFATLVGCVIQFAILYLAGKMGDR